MKTTETLIEELKQAIRHEHKTKQEQHEFVVSQLQETIASRNRVVKELECSRGLYRLNYEQQTKRLQQIVEVLGADPNAIRSDASDEEFQALVITAAQEHKKWNVLKKALAVATKVNIEKFEKYQASFHAMEELGSLKKAFAELKAKLNVLEDRMSVPEDYKNRDCECVSCKHRRQQERRIAEVVVKGGCPLTGTEAHFFEPDADSKTFAGMWFHEEINRPKTPQPAQAPSGAPPGAA